MSIKINELRKKLPGVTVRRTGVMGLGKKVEFEGGGLKYRVDKGAFKDSGEMAAAIASRIPGATMIPGQR